MKLSIIIAAYNAENTIGKCLDSILAQDIKEKEIIVVDDGSKDNTLNIIMKYEECNSEIKVISQANKGQGCARNKAIEIATGDYITFVDSDDYLEENLYLKLIEKCNKENLDILIYNYFLVQNNIKEKVVQFSEEKLYNSKEIIDKFLLTNEVEGYSCNKIFNRKLIEEYNINFLEGKMYEDIPFVVKAIIHSNKIAFDNTFGYNYIQYESSTTSTVNIKNLSDHVDSMLLIIDLIRTEYSKEMDSQLSTFIKKRVKKYSIHRFKNLLKRRINLKEFIYIIGRYNELLEKVK